MGINSYNASNTSPIDRLGALVGVVKAGKETYDSFKDSARKSDEREQAADPNSPLSMEVKRQATAAGIQVPENLTAHTAQQTGLLDYVQKAALEKQKQAGDVRLKIAELKSHEQQDKAPKGDQFKAATFGKRLEQAEGVFSSLADSGYDPTGLESGAQRTTIFGVGIPERFKSEQVKQQDQAERNFVNAVLRRESGSAIAPSEFESAAQQYFPRPGDTAEVLKQKAANRGLVLQGLKAESGGAWAKFDAPNQETMTASVPKGKGGGLIPEAMANDQSNNVRVMNGATYVKVKGGWKRM